jgi:H+/Cl- antiporter ClcA
VLLAGESMGLGADRPWDVMAAAMAVGVAVGMRSPLVAIFLIPEMLGAYRLVPFIALVVGVAVILDRGLDRVLVSAGRSVPTDVYDADA